MDAASSKQRTKNWPSTRKCRKVDRRRRTQVGERKRGGRWLKWESLTCVPKDAGFQAGAWMKCVRNTTEKEKSSFCSITHTGSLLMGRWWEESGLITNDLCKAIKVLINNRSFVTRNLFDISIGEPRASINNTKAVVYESDLRQRWTYVDNLDFFVKVYISTYFFVNITKSLPELDAC